jgi:excisionase family DNA binding protein
VPQTTFAFSKAFYRPKEVCDIIGFGASMVYKFIRQRKLKAVDVERSLRVPAWAIQEWIDEHSGRPVSD